MDPLSIAAGISSIGSLAGGLIGANSAGGLNAANRAWQTQMSNTQYQRGVEDMRKAGLNPLMMYGKGGMSATVPSVAPQQNPGQLAGAGLENAARTMGALPQAKAELALTKQNTATGAATEDAQTSAARLNDARQITEGMTQNYLDAQRQGALASADYTRGQTAYLGTQVQEALTRMEMNRANAKKAGMDYLEGEAQLPGMQAASALKKIEADAATSGKNLIGNVVGAPNLFNDAGVGVHNTLEDYFHKITFNTQQALSGNSAKSPR